jgi:hypothetical protein
MTIAERVAQVVADRDTRLNAKIVCRSSALSRARGD